MQGCVAVDDARFTGWRERCAPATPRAADEQYIVNPLTGHNVNFASLFMTHPPTDERIRRLLGAPQATAGSASSAPG